MENLSKWSLTDEEKDAFIDALTPNLMMLRIKVDISQEELANLIGVSRQTYGAIERQDRKMTWSTFLALIMFYDCNHKTHQLIRSINAFPYQVIKRFNEGNEEKSFPISSLLGDDMEDIIDALDEHALRSIRTMILVEYARCTKTPGDMVVKSFDGINFHVQKPKDEKIQNALNAIKRKK